MATVFGWIAIVFGVLSAIRAPFRLIHFARRFRDTEYTAIAGVASTRTRRWSQVAQAVTTIAVPASPIALGISLLGAGPAIWLSIAALVVAIVGLVAVMRVDRARDAAARAHIHDAYGTDLRFAPADAGLLYLVTRYTQLAAAAGTELEAVRGADMRTVVPGKIRALELSLALDGKTVPDGPAAPPSMAASGDGGAEPPGP